MTEQQSSSTNAISKTRQSRLARVWNYLTRPHPSILDFETLRQSRLLAGFQMAILFSSVFGQIAEFAEGYGIDWLLWFAASIMVVLYVVNRRGYFKSAAYLTILHLFIFFHTGPIFSGNLVWLFFTSSIVILAAILLNFRWTFLIVVLSIIVQFGLAVSNPLIDDITNASPLVVFVFTSTMILVFMHHRTMLEQERQAELQEANRQLRESESELEERVNVRTHELQSAKQELELALQQAIAADQVKSQFLASMSHELRTPLNAILNFTRFNIMGVYGELSSRQRDSMDKIVGSAEHLLDLINDVLDIAKIESGNLQLFVEDDINLNIELDGIVSAAESLLASKSDRVHLKVAIDDSLPIIVGDRRRIRQVILNLVSNACKFTEAGSVTISAQQVEATVHVSVLDTGPGIVPDMIDIIFEPFQQTETGIQHSGGTGLGLPIAKRLVEAHQGKIWVETTAGKGSKFHVEFPIYTIELVRLMEQGENETDVQ